MQSSDYMPGVSGWKMENGRLEMNQANIQVGASQEAPQMITVTAGDWAESDLPANGIERYAFIGAELAKVPDEWRESAEISTANESYDESYSDIRTTLTYTRPETDTERTARLAKTRTAALTVIFKNGRTDVFSDGVVRSSFGDLTQPFAVVGDQVFINSASIETEAVARSKLSAMWSVKMTVNAKGQYVAYGIDLTRR
jgi:hypothetical protein